MRQRSGYIDRLESLFLVVTNRCSGGCPICDYWRIEPKKDLPLTFIQEKIVPLIRQYGVQVLFVTGGEPTLHPQLPQIIETIKQTGSTITLITNGSHLKENIEQIVDRVDAFIISIDASNKTLHQRIRKLDNFDEIVNWPEKIKTKNPAVQVAYSFLIQKQNIADIVDFYLRFCTLPCDAIIFNVPELKSYSFGRRDTVPRESLHSAMLTRKEIEILEYNLQKIQPLDVGRNKLIQSTGFFTACVEYFKHLKGESAASAERICEMPFQSLVVDEFQQIRPCFYLPFSNPLHEDDQDVSNSRTLRRTRERILNSSEFRKKYCRYCLQFQS